MVKGERSESNEWGEKNSGSHKIDTIEEEEEKDDKEVVSYFSLLVWYVWVSLW